MQFLKKPFTMAGSGPDYPKILKLPQGEIRWAPDRTPVDVGDVMMQMRMDPNKMRLVGESVSRYAKGVNPYGEFGQPYKIRVFRPPVIPNEENFALSRMPQKFKPVTVGPIVSDLYKKQVSIAKVSPKATIDRVCPDAGTNPSARAAVQTSYPDRVLELYAKTPRSAVQAMPSIYVASQQDREMELDPRMTTSASAGIHMPFTHSDWSRDVNNLRTPSNVSVRPNIGDVFTPGGGSLAESDGLSTIDLRPKIRTAVWNNPNYYYIDTQVQGCLDSAKMLTTPKVQTSATTNPNDPAVANFVNDSSTLGVNTEDFIASQRVQVAAQAPSSYRLIQHQGTDTPIRTVDRVQTSRLSNPSYRILDSTALNERASHTVLAPSIHAGEYVARPGIPTIQEHQVYTRAKDLTSMSNAGESMVSSYDGRENFEVTPVVNSSGSIPDPDQVWGPGGMGQQTYGLPTMSMRSSAIKSKKLNVSTVRSAIEPLNGMDSGVRGIPIDGNNKFVKW